MQEAALPALFFQRHLDSDLKAIFHNKQEQHRPFPEVQVFLVLGQQPSPDFQEEGQHILLEELVVRQDSQGQVILQDDHRVQDSLLHNHQLQGKVHREDQDSSLQHLAVHNFQLVLQGDHLVNQAVQQL